MLPLRLRASLVVLTTAAALAATLATVPATAQPVAAVGTTTGSAATTTARTTTATAARRAAASCSYVSVLAVDGRGRGRSTGAAGLDPALRGVVSTMRRRALSSGVSVTVGHLGVAFPGGATLAPVGTGGKRADRVVTRKRATAWLGRVTPVVMSVLSDLRAQANACPEQSYVLVGRAQGASVAHRVLLRADHISGLDGRVVGAVLVSDADRRSGSLATTLGAPAASAAGRGVLSFVGLGVPDVPAGPRVVSLCSRADLVCDLRATTVARSREAFASYTTPSARSAITSAGARMWGRASAWPRPVGGQKVVAIPGAALSRRLLVKVGKPYAGGVVFDSVTGLPDGLQLSEQGVLSGAVAAPGSYTIGYRMHGTSPTTSSSAGRVTVIVSSPTTGAQVSAGAETTCVLDTAATATCAGQNFFGSLGDGTSTDRTTGVQVGPDGGWDDVSTGGASTCAVTVRGLLYCWGSNARGQLGLGGGRAHGTPQRVGTYTHWTQVSVGWFHACAVRDVGSLWCWGGNSEGQLGTGGRKLQQAPVRIGTDTDWDTVAVGGWHTCATKDDGTAWCWGRNDFGQVGIGRTGRVVRPNRVVGDDRFVSLDATWSDTCGLTQQAQVRCWGLNDHGQLGDGTRLTRTAPTAVGDRVRWASVSVGDSHTCGVDDRGAAWCWGANRYGQLGTGTLRDALSPVPVAGDRTWTSVDLGWLHSCGLGTDGGVTCWGSNEHGQLGRGDTEDALTP